MLLKQWEDIALSVRPSQKIAMSDRFRPGSACTCRPVRVAIARALVNRPSLLLCDEPTGNLDTATAQQILELLDELHTDGITLIVITHDPEVAARGMRTLTIRDGLLPDRTAA